MSDFRAARTPQIVATLRLNPQSASPKQRPLVGGVRGSQCSSLPLTLAIVAVQRELR